MFLFMILGYKTELDILYQISNQQFLRLELLEEDRTRYINRQRVKAKKPL